MGTPPSHTPGQQVPARGWGLGGEWRNLGLRVHKFTCSCSLTLLYGHIYVRPRDPLSLADWQESFNGTKGSENARWHIESCDSSKITLMP